jgi:hypothetical protein
VPDAGFTVRFPTATPTEADLTGYLIDTDLPNADRLLGLARDFQARSGTFRGWSAEEGLT